MSALHNTRRDVIHLIDAVGHLAASLLPGTAPAWRAPTMSAQRRAELDAAAREELLHDSPNLPPFLRQKQGAVAPGETPAPMSLDISELLVEILIAGEGLAEVVAQSAGVERLDPASSSYVDPRPYLRHVYEHLIAAADEAPYLIEEVAQRCVRLLARAHEVLGLITDGQMLDTQCPWCDGKTSNAPVGGKRTLRVRTLPGGLPAVVCEGGACDPPEAECGARWRGLPAWPQHEWEWLAFKLRVAS